MKDSAELSQLKSIKIRIFSFLSRSGSVQNSDSTVDDSESQPGVGSSDINLKTAEPVEM